MQDFITAGDFTDLPEARTAIKEQESNQVSHFPCRGIVSLEAEACMLGLEEQEVTKSQHEV